MSFTSEIRDEICQSRLFSRQREAQLCGMLFYSQIYSVEQVVLHTESEKVAELYTEGLLKILGIQASNAALEQLSGERRMYAVTVRKPEDTRQILEHFVSVKLDSFTDDEQKAFLSGVFLVCGNVNDPEKSYHLEFTVRSDENAVMLLELLEGFGLKPGLSSRRKNGVIYVKESEKIEELLTLIGASRFALTIMDVKIYKDMRNNVNRRLNCDTANIEKMVTSAARQVEFIRLIDEQRGLDALPEPLQTVARIRLENPVLSLSELAFLIPGRISRSTLNYRLKKLEAIAREITPKHKKQE